MRANILAMICSGPRVEREKGQPHAQWVIPHLLRPKTWVILPPVTSGPTTVFTHPCHTLTGDC
jgi:hypothetical protein